MGVTDGNGNPITPGQTLTPGQSITLSASGLTPGASYIVQAHSTPVTLGTAVANSSGVAIFTATVPSSIGAGAHTIVFVDSTGITVASFSFSVQAANAATTTDLANTGSDSGRLVGIGSVLVMAGGLLLVAFRKRPRGKHSW